MMRTVLSLLILLVAWPAQATTVQALKLDELIARADVVVLGHIGSTHAVRRKGRVFTEAEFVPQEVLKGAPPFVVRVLGGELDGLRSRVPGMPTPVRGTRVLLMARRSAGALSPVGLSQGWFVIGADAKGDIMARRDLAGLTLVGEGDAANQRLRDVLAAVRRVNR